MPPQPNLTGIPPSVSLRIFASLKPIDILSLRKTCKTLEKLTRERQVWQTAFRLHCEAHGIFTPSYPLESMTPRQLEGAVLCPYRLAHSMAHEDAQLFKSVGSIDPPRTFDEALNWEERDEDEEDEEVEDNPYMLRSFAHSLLVPGGRFFITSLVVEEAMLAVWDLGSPGQRKIRWRPIACTTIGGAGSHVHAAVPTPCGQGLRILLEVNVGEDDIYAPRFDVLEIFPLAEKPKFKTLKSMPLLKRPRITSYKAVYGHQLNKVAIHYLKKVTIWDVEADTRITFNVGDTFHKICAIEDHVILIQNTGKIMVWQVPSSSQPDEEENSLPAKQMLQISVPHHPQSSSIEHILIASPNTVEVPKCISVISKLEDSKFIYYNDLFELAPNRTEEDESDDLSFSLSPLLSNNRPLNYTKTNPTWITPEVGYKIGAYYMQLDYLSRPDSEHKLALIKEIKRQNSSDTSEDSDSSSTPLKKVRELIEASTGFGDSMMGGELFCPYSGRLILLQGEMAAVLEYNQVTSKQTAGSGAST